MRAIFETISSISLLPIVFFCFDFGRMLRGARFVDHVDRLVGQMAVGDEARRQFGRGRQRARRILDAVMLLEARLQPAQDRDRLLDGRLDTSTFWKRRDSAASFSKMPRYSVKVVAPMHLSVPDDSAGFSRFDASSVPPDAAPAPISVWISSMNRIACGRP
jgi:hypothetical protein